MPLLYDTAVGLYGLGVRLAAPFVPKASALRAGRKGLWDGLAGMRDALRGCIWMHSASVGEFEQGLPVLETLKARHPERPVLLTFHSPSGYEARKDHPIATHVAYLPADDRANARRLAGLLADIRPSMVLWVKYEWWYHLLKAVADSGTPLYLVSGIFRSGQPFFRWYGWTWRRMLSFFTHLFVQDEGSARLLHGLGVRHVSVSGDTRYDRVRAIVEADERLPIAEAFRKASEAPVLVAGSTWPKDDSVLLEALRGMKRPPRIIVAPHELDAAGLERIARSYPAPVVRWSSVEAALEQRRPVEASYDGPDQDPLDARTLLVDRMGLLSRLYRYGDLAYVGGGFTDGIHSILEAAAWGMPVVFGPHNGKFMEAGLLQDSGGGFVVHDTTGMRKALERLLEDPLARREAGRAAARMVESRAGASGRVYHRIMSTG